MSDGNHDINAGTNTKAMPEAEAAQQSEPDKMFRHMKAGTSWYGEDAEGRIQVTNAIWQPGLPLSTAARVALALTQLCCERKMGKVYITVPHPSSQKEGIYLPVFAVFKALPELFYVPGHWLDDDQREWNVMDPEEQLHRLSSRHGWIPRRMAVLPFALDVDKEQLGRPSIQGFTDALITVYISPYAYVGVTEHMRAMCTREWTPARDNTKPIGTRFTGKEWGWESFEEFKVDGGRGILDALERIYRNGCEDYEDPVVYYEILERRWIQAGQEAAQKQQANEAEDKETTD